MGDNDDTPELPLPGKRRGRRDDSEGHGRTAHLTPGGGIQMPDGERIGETRDLVVRHDVVIRRHEQDLANLGAENRERRDEIRELQKDYNVRLGGRQVSAGIAVWFRPVVASLVTGAITWIAIRLSTAGVP